MVSSDDKNNPFSPIEDCIEDVRGGKIVIIVDDKSRNNEGVFFQAAGKVTPTSVNFFITHARGMIFLPCLKERLDHPLSNLFG